MAEKCKNLLRTYGVVEKLMDFAYCDITYNVHTYDKANRLNEGGKKLSLNYYR